MDCEHARERRENLGDSTTESIRLIRVDETSRRGACDGQSVERRRSGALSDFEISDGIWDFTGAIPLLSTRGVSTRPDISAWEASAERECPGGCRERGRDTARASNICAAP
jgi:hypothetical protein